MALLWTTPADVTDRWVGGTIPATEPQISVLLEDAEDTVLREFPDLGDRIDTTDGPPLRRVRKVVARVVIRHLRNPEGVRSNSEGAGPYQRQTTFGGEEPGALFLTDEDRRELGGTKTGRAFQIDMTPASLPDDRDPTLWTSTTTWGSA